MPNTAPLFLTDDLSTRDSQVFASVWGGNTTMLGQPIVPPSLALANLRRKCLLAMKAHRGRHYMLFSDDLVLASTKRPEATQLGFAMMLLCLRYPDRAAAAGKSPPTPIVAFVARQLSI